jgi:hypothetical protein
MAALLALGATTLGCHVFSPGLSSRQHSGQVSPDSGAPGPDLRSSEDEDAQATETEGSLAGLASTVGCSDGTREGFRDFNRWPSIAGCAGGWQKLGLPVTGALATPCAGIAGNSSPSPDGLQCSPNDACVECGVADLCAPSWRPCMSGQEVIERSRTGCEDILPPGEKGLFIAMLGASMNGVCEANEHNDLHGCGNLGSPENDQCPPFTRRMGFADCDNTNGVWKCGGPTQNTREADVVIKTRPDLGGILCCKN